MKILILSDIHSNIVALEAIWRAEKDCDALYCVGDLVDYGPYPKEVLDWIRAHDVPCVQGNHDVWVTMHYREGNTAHTVPPAQCGWVHHNAALLNETDICYLEALPQTMSFTLDNIDYAMTHLVRDYDELVSLYAYEQFRQNRFDGAAYTRLVLGHTHRQSIRYLSNELLWLNPGSASYRRLDDPDQTAHYATIVDGRLSLHRLTYNTTSLYQVVQKTAVNPEEKATAERFFGPR